MTNSWVGIGRLTKDPIIRSTKSGSIVSNFVVAINRGKDKNGEDKGVDYIPVTVFGRQAENCERFLAKGRLVGVKGRIQTGSYTNKDGITVYTTDVVADRVEFLEWADKATKGNAQAGENAIPEGFAAVTDDDIPF